ncbi:hypothetical protein [Nitratireductor sp. GCM10026969]|uniref:hypothetical protein n=1 Tax=Nitratireductor sp. GCM10026969 TaxID=3252645 RepID=UPI003619BE4C
MIEQGYINDGLAPSYFLEGMLSNVPTQHFVASRQQTFENYMHWLQTCPANFANSCARRSGSLNLACHQYSSRNRSSA